MPKVKKEYSDMFSKVFGEDMKGENVPISESETPTELVSNMVNRGETPPGLKIVEIVFGYITSFITAYVPIGLIFGICASKGFTKEIIPSILEVFLFSGSSFLVIKLVEFLISCLFIIYYSKKLDKIAELNKKMENKIKQSLKEKDKSDGIVNDSDNAPKSAAETFGIICQNICKYIVSEPGKPLPTDIGTIGACVQAIVYNIIIDSEDLKDKIKDESFVEGILNKSISIDEKLFNHVEDKVLGLYVFEYICKYGRSTNWNFGIKDDVLTS